MKIQEMIKQLGADFFTGDQIDGVLKDRVSKAMKYKNPEKRLQKLKDLKELKMNWTDDHLSILDKLVKEQEETIKRRAEVWKRATSLGKIPHSNKSRDRGQGILVVEKKKTKPYFSLDDVRRANPIK